MALLSQTLLSQTSSPVPYCAEIGVLVALGIIGQVNKEGNGYKCPKCGAEGKYHGEHYATVRQIKIGKTAVVNVGWRCWNCGHEWGFHEEPMLTEEEIKRRNKS